MSDNDGIQAWAPIEVVEGLLKRAEQAEAKIQRVREEVGTWPVALDKTVAACADSVLRALDGER